jgi:putative ABC transport system permease protein
MTNLNLIIKSFRHYFKVNLWVALGIAVTTAVLTGALIVGDSVIYSLEQSARIRLGEITHSVTSGDRFFTVTLAEKLNQSAIPTSAALKLEAIASTNGGQLKLNKVNIWGIDANFSKLEGSTPPPSGVPMDIGSVGVSSNLALRLNLTVGDEIILRIKKATLIPANAPFVSDENQSVTYHTNVGKILNNNELGQLNLQNSQTAPYNILIPLKKLNSLMGLNEKANVLLISTPKSEKEIKEAIRSIYTLSDVGLGIKGVDITDQWELNSERVFIDDAITTAVENTEIEFTPSLTYFANSFKANGNETPYSFVSSLPDSEIGTDEVVINKWLADDLKVKVGDSIPLGYFEIGPLRELTENSKTFILKKVVPIEGYFADRSLMPEIPGLSTAENCRDWQTGVPVNLKAIRDKDEDYWYNYHGLPKAFVAYSTAQKLWGNRYGSTTAFRFDRQNISKEDLELALHDQIDPFNLDWQLRSVKNEGLTAAKNGTDFSSLFIGLSFFIIAAGIILTVLLFLFNLEKRTSEIGTLSSLGFSNKMIRNLFLSEGVLVAATGSLLGLILAIGYNELVFWGLNRVWNDIVRTDVLVSKIRFTTLLVGYLISVFVAIVTLFFALNRKLKQSAASLQKRISVKMSSKRKLIVSIIATIMLTSALIIIALDILKGSGNQNAGSFFMAGGLLLMASILFLYRLLSGNIKESTSRLTTGRLIVQNLRLNRVRSLTVIILLAIGTYLVVSTGLNRQDLFGNARDPKSGTGGFLFWVESTLPVLHNLNDPGYRKKEGFTENFNVVQMSVAEGDDASCLNLNRISNPRILGLDASLLKDRFSAQTMLTKNGENDPWKLLKIKSDDCIPAIADQTVIQWGLGKKVGDTITYQNALGEQIHLRLIAGLASSVFQGNIIIDNSFFLQNFPSSSGSHVFLIDGKPDQQQQITDELELLFRDLGFEITPSAQRLAEFKSVENTYLSIFLVLGALGLFIGTIGLAIVMQRSLLERKAEFSLLTSLGFKRSLIAKMVVSEYLILLVTGVACGFVCAVVSVWPTVSGAVQSISFWFVAALVGLIVVNGLVWIVLISQIQLSKLQLVEALRNE